MCSKANRKLQKWSPLAEADFSRVSNLLNPSPAEPGCALPLQTVSIQISWLLKTTDLDLHCFCLEYVNLYH